MLCDQEPQILSQWFSAILLLCICVIHPAIKAHVLNIANFGATNQPILITACRLQISNWEILDLTFIINQHFCLLCIWFRNIHCCSQHLIGDVLLNTALLHIRVEVLPYHLFCLNEVVFREILLFLKRYEIEESPCLEANWWFRSNSKLCFEANVGHSAEIKRGRHLQTNTLSVLRMPPKNELTFVWAVVFGTYVWLFD